jgi:LAO/AO transport system kinase
MDLNKKIEQLIAGNVRAAAQHTTHKENHNTVQEIKSHDPGSSKNTAGK